MYSSYTAASFARKYELADKHGIRFEGALTWAFEFENQPYFAGFRALASNGLDLPVLNVFRMFGKMGGQRLSGKGLVFAAGLRWAIENGIRVVNLSLSTGREDYYGLFHEIADEAAFAGTILVCATNNVPAPTYPGQFSSVISVAAHDDNDPFALDANPTPPVDFGAPGIDIEVPWLSGGSIVATGIFWPMYSSISGRLIAYRSQAKLIASPSAPSRAVRPMRCT